jgi:hypothetical protein
MTLVDPTKTELSASVDNVYSSNESIDSDDLWAGRETNALMRKLGHLEQQWAAQKLNVERTAYFNHYDVDSKSDTSSLSDASHQDERVSDKSNGFLVLEQMQQQQGSRSKGNVSERNVASLSRERHARMQPSLCMFPKTRPER